MARREEIFVFENAVDAWKARNRFYTGRTTDGCANRGFDVTIPMNGTRLTVAYASFRQITETSEAEALLGRPAAAKTTLTKLPFKGDAPQVSA